MSIRFAANVGAPMKPKKPHVPKFKMEPVVENPVPVVENSPKPEPEVEKPVQEGWKARREKKQLPIAVKEEVPEPKSE